MKISNLQQFEAFLKTRIPSRDALFMGDIGLRRAKYFMHLLGNPQNKIKIVHIAGTSGKGSTAYLTSHILQSQGFNVGLSISPHVFDIRERMQINNQLSNEKLILKYLNEILPVILKMEKSKYGSPTFFEINVGLAYYMFAKENLDYAVMETGLGGLLDGTNTVTSKNKVCIITKLGLDHTEILGNTIEKIAEQKAGIIQKQNTVISIKQNNKAGFVISQTCLDRNSDLIIIDRKNYKTISSSADETTFNYKDNHFSLDAIQLGLIGLHQAENCSIALACLSFLSKRDRFQINEGLLRSKLRNICIPGRMEIFIIEGQTIILDGAHNPQKMQTFTSNLSKIFPKQKFEFIVAFKKGKDHKEMIKTILPLANKIYLAGFATDGQDNFHSSVDNQEIGTFLQSQNFSNFEIIEKYSDILQIIRMAQTNLKEKKPIILTGSLYFVGNIYTFIRQNN